MSRRIVQTVITLRIHNDTQQSVEGNTMDVDLSTSKETMSMERSLMHLVQARTKAPTDSWMTQTSLKQMATSLGPQQSGSI